MLTVIRFRVSYVHLSLILILKKNANKEIEKNVPWHGNALSRISEYNDVIMSPMASQITSLTIVYSTVYSGADQKKHQSSASLVFMRGIHRWPVNCPTKGQWRGNCFHLMTSSCDDSPWFLLPHDSSCRPFPQTMPSVVEKMGLFLRNELKQFSAKINLFSNKKWAWKWCLQNIGHLSGPVRHTLYPLKYAHGLAVLYFVVVII